MSNPLTIFSHRVPYNFARNSMIKMQADWKDIRRRQRYFIREIDPLKVIEVMQDVFTQEDCENIRTACTNHGPIVAVRDHLLGRLKRRGPNSLPKFVLALRKTGQEHAAQLIDPKMKGINHS